MKQQWECIVECQYQKKHYRRGEIMVAEEIDEGREHLFKKYVPPVAGFHSDPREKLVAAHAARVHGLVKGKNGKFIPKDQVIKDLLGDDPS